MAWPQAPQPAPAAPPAAAGKPLPLGPIITAAGGFLTFLFSFVQIVKIDNAFADDGWSVWTTNAPGLFGVGTWIPIFALVAAAVALARAFAPALAEKQVAGFGLLQIQMAAALFAFLLWLGYVVNGFLAEDLAPALGALLLFVSLAAVLAGTALSLMDLKKGTTTSIGTSPGGPPSGQWPAGPTGPQPHSAPGGPAPQPYPGPPSGQWPQPTPPPAPGTGQWPAPGQEGPPPQQWQPSGQPAPGQWQPDPGAPPPPPQTWAPAPGPEQAWQPPTGCDPAGPSPAPPVPSPEPGPLDPQPAPPIDPGGPDRSGGGLYDPGTQVIPGPPPAPPADDPGHVGGGPDALPPVPPSNTP